MTGNGSGFQGRLTQYISVILWLTDTWYYALFVWLLIGVTFIFYAE